MQGNFSVSRAFVSEDPFLNLTGDGPSFAFSGSVFYEMPNIGGTLENNRSGCFGFHSGYLNSYSISCGVGEVPSVNVGISVYGDLGPGIDARYNGGDAAAARCGDRDGADSGCPRRQRAGGRSAAAAWRGDRPADHEKW